MGHKSSQQAYIFLMKIVDVVALVLALIGQCSRIWYFAKTNVVAGQSLIWLHVCRYQGSALLRRCHRTRGLPDLPDLFLPQGGLHLQLADGVQPEEGGHINIVNGV